MLGQRDRDVHEAAEIGMHAGQEACNTIARICGACNSSVATAMAIATAFGYIQLKLETLRKTDPEFVAKVDELQHMTKDQFDGKQD